MQTVSESSEPAPSHLLGTLLHRIATLIVAILTLCLSTGSAFCEQHARSGSVPNVVLILADDLGYGELGSFGQKHIQTPHLDRLAAEGMKLTRFYAGAPLCLPSRCSLMTGLHTGHARCRVNGGGGKHPELTAQDTTVATMLRRAGYTTGMFGKWSLGDRFRGCAVDEKNVDGDGAIYKHGWDVYFGEPNQTYNHAYYPKVVYRYDPQGLVGDKTPVDALVPVPLPENPKAKTHYRSDLELRDALAFIDSAGDRPFFLYLPSTLPHSNYEVPKMAPYAAELDTSQSGRIYASMISHLDQQVGQIVARLKQHGLEKRTLVLFTSDNGGQARFPLFDSNGGLLGAKGDVTEGGLRVPTVAWWPGTIAPGTSSDQPLAFWDVLPTCAELAGIAPPEGIDGVSFVPTLTGRGEQKVHDYLYFRYGKRELILRRHGETRSDDEIRAEALTDVVVPEF